MIAATDSELFRCLHLPSEGLVTLSQEKLLRYYIRERSEYELTKQFCLPNREGVVTDLARSFRGDREAYFSVRYTLDDEHLVVGGTGGYVNIIGSDHPTCYSFNAHQSDVRAICCSKANPHIFYSGSVDGQCKIWDDRSLNDSIPLAITSRSGYSVTYIDSDSYDRYMVVTTLGETIDIWDLRRIPENLPQRQTTELRFDTALRIKAKNILEVFWRAKFSPQRTGHRYIYCGSDGGHIYVFDILTNQIVREFRKCRREVRDCSWHPNDCEIISVSVGLINCC
uniref:DUF2415 domain-containing protein n=1 Tax=Setaria digitata TaxID=48799 RepID=A0A915Q8E2_9BILA